MSLQELIDFHVIGAESCEAYAVTPGASEAKSKDIAKHYTKRAKWHRDAVELISNARHQGEPVAWIKPEVLATLRKDECCYAFGEQSPKGNLVPLYAEQPAPVAVVMPERMTDTWNGNRDYLTYDKGWNDALEAVSRLNGVKP